MHFKSLLTASVFFAEALAAIVPNGGQFQNRRRQVPNLEGWRNTTTTPSGNTTKTEADGRGLPVVEVNPHPQCEVFLERKAWDDFTESEQQEYIDAELCLMTQIPTQTNLTAAITLYDDLVKVHQLLYWIIHHTGWFLPYHRFMTHTHETLLRTYCNYTGAQPYWNESPDAGSFRNSTTLNSFGGPGGPDTCVDQAPFAGIPLHIGPGFENQDHCIFRNISETASAGTSYTSVQRCMDRSLPGPTLLSDSTLDTTANTAAYESFWHCLEGAPHAGGHNGVGGGMQDAVASPGDPLFWLHHAWIDKIWYDWQVQNERRGGFEALAGYRTMEEPVDGWVNVTVGDVMPMFGLVGDRTIESVMRPETELCYTYVEAKANVARREALAAQAAQSGRA